jgi:type II secretory ATPase GspE/PulE/Tfp pilus assembly ATPase PilB-like protein
MDTQVLITLKSGQTVAGCLARPLAENDMEVEICTEGGERKLLFSLDEICSIRFQQLPWALGTGEPTMAEEVQTIAGESFRVAVLANRRFFKGFVGLLQDEAGYAAVFFSSTGVRYRREERLTGQILQEKGFVSNDGIEGALRAQEMLRARRMGEVIAESADLAHEEIEQTLQEAAGKPEIPRDARVGDILVEAGLVTREQVESAFEKQQKGKRLRVGELLVRQGLVTEEQLLSALTAKFRLHFVDLSKIVPSEEALGALSPGLVDRLQVFPVALNGRTLVVVTSTPTDPTVGDSLRFSTNLHIELVVAPPRQIAAAIAKYYHNRKDALDTLFDPLLGEVESVSVEEEVEETRVSETDSEVIALLNRILIEAYRRGASDIHIEPGAGKNPVAVRYRIDGECVPIHRIGATFKNAIVSRIKIVAGLDISERRRPQSGKILLRFEQRKLEYRVEITPTVGGHEDVVMRLLATAKPLPLGEIGLMPCNLERLHGILDKPYGIILCVGPTGSGKTTTLHSALVHLNTPGRKVWTAEDPVEITQPGLRQVQVNAKIGYSFSEALRSFLRADPDVIMVGEMRDVETAKIAIEASLTGHLVLSTLHTNSAPETAVRLVDMGMDPFNFADALLGILAQRLARRLCDHCKKSVRPKRETYDILIADFEHSAGRLSEQLPAYEDAVLMVRSGCEHCGGSGYKGRIAIHELMLGSATIKNAIRQGLGVAELLRTALAEGMWPLRADGILKVFQGYTDLEQISRVCL